MPSKRRGYVGLWEGLHPHRRASGGRLDPAGESLPGRQHAPAPTRITARPSRAWDAPPLTHPQPGNERTTEIRKIGYSRLIPAASATAKVTAAYP